MNQTPHEVVRVVGVALLAMGKKSIFDEATKQILGEIWQQKLQKFWRVKANVNITLTFSQKNQEFGIENFTFR